MITALVTVSVDSDTDAITVAYFRSGWIKRGVGGMTGREGCLFRERFLFTGDQTEPFPRGMNDCWWEMLRVAEAETNGDREVISD